MIELLEKIETILVNNADSSTAECQEDPGFPASHTWTSWTGERIVSSLRSQLPAAKGEREREASEALRHKRYSRCKIYPQLAEDSDFIKAITCISDIPKAMESGNSALPALFNECADAILKAHDQTIMAIVEDDPATLKERERAKRAKESVVSQLEKLAIDVFAKGLGDEAEQ